MIRIDTHELSRLIGHIYDCALVPDGWADVLTQINTLIGGAYTTISLGDSTHPHAVMAVFSPWEPGVPDALSSAYGIDGVPGLRDVVYGPIDVPRSALQQANEDAFRGSAFYRDWAQPHGLRDACLTKFAQTDGRIGILATITNAGRGAIVESERAFMAMISPHVRRAAMIGDIIEHSAQETQIYRSAVDGISTPVVLVDGSASIVHMNEAAETMLEAGRLIVWRSGRLEAVNEAACEALHDAIARSAHNDEEIGDRGIGIPLSAAIPAVAYVLPLARGEARESLRPAAAAVFIATSAQAMPPPRDALISLFNLTPSETRILLEIGAGSNVRETALALKLSENTIKSHLARVYAKTGTSRQVELVKLLISLSPPRG
jgi:DNA-binding CsgD family transcriptional regulator/PAS domain-containing protein